MKPRHQNSSIKYHFPDGCDILVPLVDQTANMIIQFVQMALSDDPRLSAKGKENIKMIAEYCVAGQFTLEDQRKKASMPRRYNLEQEAIAKEYLRRKKASEAYGLTKELAKRTGVSTKTILAWVKKYT